MVQKRTKSVLNRSHMKTESFFGGRVLVSRGTLKWDSGSRAAPLKFPKAAPGERRAPEAADGEVPEDLRERELGDDLRDR